MPYKSDYNAFRKGPKQTFTHGVYAAVTVGNTPSCTDVYATANAGICRELRQFGLPSEERVECVYADRSLPGTGVYDQTTDV